MDSFTEWIHDDITWCGNECSYTKCERNLANRISKSPYFSAALFKGSCMCPLTQTESEEKKEE